MKKLFLVIFLSAIFINVSCTLSAPKPPKLVIFFVVDQMRPDLLTRFDKIYSGGLKWLIDNGIWYTDTHHEHSYTATGPGHTAIGYGQHPGKLGVIGNSFYDRELGKTVNCVEDPNAKVVGAQKGKARSSSRYDADGLGDWLKSKYPSSKVISIAGKDRAACLLGGRNPDQAIYYNKSGAFISSDYYVDELPKWASDFNQEFKKRPYQDSLWFRSLDEQLYIELSREDYFYGEEDNYLNNEYSPVFPIGIDSGQDPYPILMGTPWFEREILELSKDAVAEEMLGADDNPDFLFISFSAMDWMIHSYGPYSQEVMDACIKLDRYIGNFIEFLDRSIGLENILFTLTADHGGLPLPEFLSFQGKKGGRINKKHMQEALTWIDEECEELFGKKLYHRDGGNFFLDMDRIKKANVSPQKIYDIIEGYLTKVDGIEKMIIKEEIINTKDADSVTRRLKNMIHPVKTPDVFPLVSYGYLYRGPYGTSHGSPYDYDTHVPLIFARKGFRKEQNDKRAATVDIAPTISRYLGIEIPEYCDGESLNF